MQPVEESQVSTEHAFPSSQSTDVPKQPVLGSQAGEVHLFPPVQSIASKTPGVPLEVLHIFSDKQKLFVWMHWPLVGSQA